MSSLDSSSPPREQEGCVSLIRQAEGKWPRKSRKVKKDGGNGVKPRGFATGEWGSKNTNDYSQDRRYRERHTGTSFEHTSHGTDNEKHEPLRGERFDDPANVKLGLTGVEKVQQDIRCQEIAN
jgi:hypothetical protein